MAGRRRAVLVTTTAVAVVTADQLTKAWALRRLASGPIEVGWTLRLNLEFNPGVAFSQARGSAALNTVIALAVLAVVVGLALRSTNRAMSMALGLVIGGAVGNLADRLVRHHHGAVVDWIDLRWWPVFNLADAAITCGVVLALALSLLPTRTRSRPRA